MSSFGKQVFPMPRTGRQAGKARFCNCRLNMPIRGIRLSRIPVWLTVLYVADPKLELHLTHGWGVARGNVQDLGGDSEVAAVVACSWGWLQWEQRQTTQVQVVPVLLVLPLGFLPSLPAGLQEPQVPSRYRAAAFLGLSSSICVPLFQPDVLFPDFPASSEFPLTLLWEGSAMAFLCSFHSSDWAFRSYLLPLFVDCKLNVGIVSVFITTIAVPGT